ncbi:MAG: tetratricopeptide repeat protein [Myxococcales bacterium]|nr:tetratricopeptide repeat protein [Myxococcales bacterium]
MSTARRRTDVTGATCTGASMHAAPTPTTARLHLRALGALALAVTAACGGAQLGPTVEYEFEPQIFRSVVDETGTRTLVETDLPSLFAEATDYLNADSYEDAIRLYAEVLEATDDPEYVRAARYNSALALEGLGRWREAGELYRDIVVSSPETTDGRDAHFRLAECFAQVGQHDAVPPLMERLQGRIDLSVTDKVELHLRWGVALLEQREFAGAAAQFDEALAENRRAALRYDPESSPRSEQPVEQSDALVAQTLFELGEVYHGLFSEVRFVLPEERLTQDLVAKSRLFEQAQEAYLEAVRTGNPYWAVAAGYKVGELFEDYYYDVLATEVPSDFNDIELEVYFEELRAFVAPAMVRAEAIYQHNLAMAFRLGYDGEWVDATLASLERVHQYMATHEGWEEEHQLIVERRHPHSAYYAEHEQPRGAAASN